MRFFLSIASLFAVVHLDHVHQAFQPQGVPHQSFQHQPFRQQFPHSFQQQPLRRRTKAKFVPWQQQRQHPPSSHVPTYAGRSTGLLEEEVKAKASAVNEPMSKVASVVFSNFGQSEVHGYVMFSQSTPSDAVRIRGEVFNLSPDGAHGFHVHESGDLRSGCTSAKGHFNPYGAVHGAPTDAERHVGDLGNIFAEGGTARFDYVDLKISLFEGSNNIIGRSVVVHQGRDDLGRGLDAGSKIHGNAGPRLACGVIGIVAP